MARGNGTPVAAHDRSAKAKQPAHTAADDRRPHARPRRPVRCQLHRRRRPRPDLRAPLDPPGRPSLRRDHLGVPDRRHRQRVGQERLRAEGRRGPRLLEPARHQRRGQQVLPRPPQHARARDLRPPAHRSRRQHDHGLGGDPALLRDGRRPPDVQGRADPPAHPPEDGVQLAGLVQRRDRREAAVQRLLHQLGRGHDVLDHGPRQDRGDALQVRLGRGQQPLHHPLVQGEDGRRRHRLGPGLAS